MFFYSKKDKSKLVGKKTDKTSICTTGHHTEIFLTSYKNTDIKNEALKSKDVHYTNQEI